MVRLGIGMIFVGGILGHMLSAAVSTVVNDAGWFASSGEPSQARSYMVALLQRESAQLNALRPQQDVVSQALQEQAARESRQQAKVLSMTYLGGGSYGSFNVQIYAIEIRGNDGRQQLFPLALTLLGGKVVATR